MQRQVRSFCHTIYSDPLPGHSSIHTEGELLIIIIKINKKSLKNNKNLYSHFSRYSSEGFRLLSIQLSEQIKTQVKQELAFSNRYKLHLELSSFYESKILPVVWIHFSHF